MGLKRIVCATDFSTDAARAVRRATLLAREHAAGLELLHVVSRPRLEALRQWVRRPVDLPERLVEAAREELQQAAGEARVVIGDVVTSIAKAAAGADLLVLGARGVNPLKDVILGTTAERLLGACRGSILVVRTPPQRGYRRVLAAVDLQPGSEAALRAALLLAEDATARAVHVYDVPFEGMLQRAGVSREEVREHRLRAHRVATHKIAALSREACGDAHRFVAVTQHGPAAAGIVHSQQKTGADLLVLLKRVRSPAEKLVLGSVTRHVLADVRCDVLLVPEAKRRARAS